MKIADNKIKTVTDFLIEELKDIYPENEIRSFTYLAFEHYLGFSKSDLHAKQDYELTQEEMQHFFSLTEELKLHKPIQYVLGETEFYGLRMKVNKHVLIPRSETEELVDWIIGNVNCEGESEGEMKIIDIGTGSGCIAVSLKKNIPHADVFATDVSEEALALAEQNAVINNVELNFIRADALDNNAVMPVDNFNLIVSNPPYVLHKEKKQMQKNVLDYEPHSALFVNDNDPLLFYKAILKFANKHLEKSGYVFFEISEYLGQKVSNLIQEAGFRDIELKKDINNKYRMISAQLL